MTNLFPHQGFPVRLEYQDGSDHRICWFQTESHLQKHIARYKLKESAIKITYADNYDGSYPSEFLNANTESEVESTEKPTPRKRGRPRKQETVTEAPKKRGRPKKMFSSLDTFFKND